MNRLQGGLNSLFDMKVNCPYKFQPIYIDHTSFTSESPFLTHQATHLTEENPALAFPLQIPRAPGIEKGAKESQMGFLIRMLAP